MFKKIFTSFFLIFGAVFSLMAFPVPIVSIYPVADNEKVITVEPQAHIDYGFSYPLTYEFAIPENSPGLQAYKKYSLKSDWVHLEEKNTGDFFNAVEAVRFDYDNHLAYISVAFGSTTDSIFIRISDQAGQNVAVGFHQICKYYDNRDAAVVMSADDMAEWTRRNGKFAESLHYLRNLHLWVTCGINSGGANTSTYRFIQAELDSGYVEAGNHTRSHPHVPYDNYQSEVIGCRDDIVNHLDLPPLFRNGNHEYVYIWIAPYGEIDDVIDSLLSEYKFLVARMYYDGFDGFPNWNDPLQMFNQIGVTREVGPLWVGTHDSTNLNNAFDEVVAKGGVYHLMCHPNVIEWDQAHTWNHLHHVSNRTNIWYASIGQLMVYHLAQISYTGTTDVAELPSDLPAAFRLAQNYPNPFNPVTTISYQMAHAGKVNLSVYNSLGRLVATLVNKNQAPGNYTVQWNGEDFGSGVYFCKIQLNGL